MNFFLDKNLLEACVKILVSAAFGIILGLERKSRFQAIGMRTLLLISVSCSLMGVFSFWGAGQDNALMGDPTRIAAGVLTGVGFIGGGAIMHQGFNIKGITTAAIIWTTAALGLAIGFGMYVPAVFVFAIAYVGLLVFQKIEDKFFPANKIKSISLVYKGGVSSDGLVRIKEIFKENGIVARDINYSKSYDEDSLTVTILASSPELRDFEKFCEQLKQTGNLQKFVFSN